MDLPAKFGDLSLLGSRPPSNSDFRSFLPISEELPKTSRFSSENREIFWIEYRRRIFLTYFVYVLCIRQYSNLGVESMGPTPRVPLCPSLLLVEADGRVVVCCHGQRRLPRRSGLDNVLGTLEGQPGAVL